MNVDENDDNGQKVRKSALKKTSCLCFKGSVSWHEDVCDPKETLWRRRHALSRFKDLFTIRGKGLVRTEESIEHCLEEAAVLPASNLEQLCAILYKLPGALWPFNVFPFAFDTEDLLCEVGSHDVTYRWWHVKLNFVLTYADSVNIKPLLESVITSQGGDATTCGSYTPKDLPFVVFLPEIPPPMEDDSRSKEGSLSTASPSPSMPSGLKVPVVRIQSIPELIAGLSALALANESCYLIKKIIDEGVSMLKTFLQIGREPIAVLN